MVAQIVIDKSGKLTLPQQVLDALGISSTTEVLVEVTEQGLIITPKQKRPSLTEQIGQMDLPVADWEQMEQEIEKGRLAS